MHFSYTISGTSYCLLCGSSVPLRVLLLSPWWALWNVRVQVLHVLPLSEKVWSLSSPACFSCRLWTGFAWYGPSRPQSKEPWTIGRSHKRTIGRNCLGFALLFQANIYSMQNVGRLFVKVSWSPNLPSLSTSPSPDLSSGCPGVRDMSSGCEFLLIFWGFWGIFN